MTPLKSNITMSKRKLKIHVGHTTCVWFLTRDYVGGTQTPRRVTKLTSATKTYLETLYPTSARDNQNCSTKRDATLAARANKRSGDLTNAMATKIRPLVNWNNGTYRNASGLGFTGGDQQ